MPSEIRLYGLPLHISTCIKPDHLIAWIFKNRLLKCYHTITIKWENTSTKKYWPNLKYCRLPYVYMYMYIPAQNLRPGPANHSFPTLKNICWSQVQGCYWVTIATQTCDIIIDTGRIKQESTPLWLYIKLASPTELVSKLPYSYTKRDFNGHPAASPMPI